MAVVASSPADDPTPPFQFINARDLLNTPEEKISYCVQGLLPSSGLSVLAGKPKVGKTTLVRQLAVAVAQGKPFLGMETSQGPVLYIALEEKRSEVATHFAQLGLEETDPVLILCGSVQKQVAVKMLEATLRSMKGVSLVIIDPVIRFLSVSDGNDYVQITNAFDPLLRLARDHGVHILTVHHMEKRLTEDAIDGSLGSTAITGSVDTYLALSVTPSRVRTLLTRQRYGQDMEPTELNWDPEIRQLSLGTTCEKAEELRVDETRQRIARQMRKYVSEHEDCTQEQLMNAVQGKTISKKQVLQRLIDDGVFQRSGGGAKGDPYTLNITEMEVAPRMEV